MNRVRVFSMATACLVAAAGLATPSAVATTGLARAAQAANPDGTTTVTLTASSDTFVQTGLSQPRRSAATELVVGSSNNGLTKARSYLTFDLASAGLADVSVVAASLALSNFATGSCTGSPVRVSRVTSPWTEAGIKWGSQPQTTAAGSATSSSSYGRTGCAAEGTVSWDATAIAQAWAGGAANNGIQIMADAETKATGYRKFRSLENGSAAKTAKLTLTLNQRPNTPTGLTATPGSNGWIRSATPTLSAVVSDPAGGKVAGTFSIFVGSEPVWAGTSALVDSGKTASVQVPAGIVHEGDAYIVAAIAKDEFGATSKSAAAMWMVLDTVAPVVTVASQKFTDNTWSTTVPTSDTLTLQGGAGTSWFVISADGGSIAVGADANGAASVPYTPLAGWHDISVVAGDPAGNVSAPVHLAYGAGPVPVFSAPAAKSTQPSSFGVEVSGRPGATAGAVYWRKTGETAWRTAAKVVDANGAPWTGTIPASTARSTTGALTWNATQESFGTGTLTGPADVQIRVCFAYPAGPACSETRNLGISG